MKEQPLHIGIQQRVLPVYRVPFLISWLRTIWEK